MPQSSDELRSIMNLWFGDDVSDYGPIKFLSSRGYVLTPSWEWEPPVPSHRPSPEEWLCIVFLAEEWDFGYCKFVPPLYDRLLEGLQKNILTPPVDSVIMPYNEK